MKLEKPVHVVCDANGICLGIFSTEKLSDQVAHYNGAYVSKHNEILDDDNEWDGNSDTCIICECAQKFGHSNLCPRKKIRII